MEAVKTLEAAMEEALDQDEIIVWPEPEQQRLVTRDHSAAGRGAPGGVSVLTCRRCCGLTVSRLRC